MPPSNRDENLLPRNAALEPPGPNPALTGTFVRGGDFWTIGIRNSSFPLRDIKGFTYIQRLLQHPGEQFFALDLLTLPESGAEPYSSRVDVNALPVGVTVRRGLSGDAGEMLDARAKQDYKRRLDELKEQLEDLLERGNHERAEEVESEIEILRREISNAVGLGGRDRRAGSNAERARLNVTRAIRAGLQRIAEHDAELGDILNRSIKTGLYCSYLPDHRAPARWQFALEDAAIQQTETTETPFPRRESNFLKAFTEGTQFVGRDTEHAALHRSLEQTFVGRGNVVLIGGAAGVGKTRVAAEIAAEALRRGFLAYVGSCYDRENPDPFLPFVEILEAALAQAPSPAAFREALDKDASEIALYLPQLRRLFPDIPPPMQVSPGQSRQILFRAIAGLLQRNSRHTPIVLLLDDLHWADDATLALLSHLAQLVPGMRVLIVGTYRDFELHPTSLLAKTLEELIRLHLVDRLNLSGLSREAVAAMLRALSGRELPELVVRLFYAGTEGNPFFVEELFRHLVEQRQLIDAKGEFRTDLRVNDLDVPQSLRFLIGRRLIRLSSLTQGTLAAAAVIGRSFTFELLAASTATETDALLDCVEEAERAGLISSSVQYPEAQFRFAHPLIRQAVAQTLSVVRRRRVHLDIANAIENVYAETLEDHANALAHHLWEAGTLADPAKALYYLSMAAKRESNQGALIEAEGHYLQALAALNKLPPSHERDERELLLQLGRGSASIATRGYIDARTADAFDRASLLAERLGSPGQAVMALTGSFGVAMLKGETEAAQVQAEKLRIASERDGRPKTRIWGEMLQGMACFMRGDLEGAHQQFGKAVKLYNPEEQRRSAQDPLTESLEYTAIVEWHFGLADTARARMEEAIAIANRMAKPFVLAHNGFFAAYLYALLRDPEKSREFAEAAIEHSREQQIPVFYDAGRILWGWAVVEQGRQEEGLAAAREGFASYWGAGNRNGIGSLMSFVAEAQARCGSLNDALTTVGDGIAATQQQPGDFPQLLSLRGNLLWRKLVTDPPETPAAKISLATAAEASFREAIAVADSVGSRSFALRAATDLARLLKTSGRASSGRDLLLPLWKDFTEGFDSRDWLEAKAMLDELS